MNKDTTIYLKMTRGVLDGGGEKEITVQFPTERIIKAERDGNLLEQLSCYMFADVTKVDYKIGVLEDNKDISNKIPLIEHIGVYSEFVDLVVEYFHQEGILTSMAVAVMFGEDSNKGMQRDQVNELIEGICKNNGFAINKNDSNLDVVYTLVKY